MRFDGVEVAKREQWGSEHPSEDSAILGNDAGLVQAHA
jgi:hypothetical protein